MTVEQEGVRYNIPESSTVPSLISLNGFCGRKAPYFFWKNKTAQPVSLTAVDPEAKAGRHGAPRTCKFCLPLSVRSLVATGTLLRSFISLVMLLAPTKAFWWCTPI